MIMGTPIQVEEAYAQKRVADIDARLAALEDEKAALLETRAKFAPKKARARKSADEG